MKPKLKMEETINKICVQLPPGWTIELSIEKDTAWVNLVDPLGECPELPDSSDKTIIEQLNDALCVAKGWDMSMKETRVCKAEPLHGKIESQTIIIDCKLPLDLWPKDKAENFHHNQAQRIDDALCNSLPQGTYDRLGIMFMKKKLSIYQGITGT
jgi:hypothetical protein